MNPLFVASDGARGTRVAAVRPIAAQAAILLDVHMPRMDGLDFSRLMLHAGSGPQSDGGDPQHLRRRARQARGAVPRRRRRAAEVGDFSSSSSSSAVLSPILVDDGDPGRRARDRAKKSPAGPDGRGPARRAEKQRPTQLPRRTGSRRMRTTWSSARASRPTRCLGPRAARPTQLGRRPEGRTRSPGAGAGRRNPARRTRRRGRGPPPRAREQAPGPPRCSPWRERRPILLDRTRPL